MVLGDRVDRATLRQVTRDRGPTLSGVRRAQQVREEVAVLVIVHHREGGVRVMHRGDQALDIAVAWYAVDGIDFPPIGAAILGDLNQAVVTAHVEQSFTLRRLGNRREVGVEGRTLMLGDRLGAPNLTHDGQRVAIHLTGQVRRDRLPAVAAVLTAVEPLRRRIDPRVAMRRDDDRRVPVPARRIFATQLTRPNRHRLAGPVVIAHHATVLTLGIDRLGILRVDPRDETVATVGDKPIRTEHAMATTGCARTAEGGVVLGATADAERRGVVDVDVIHLRQREIGEEDPRLPTVPALIESAVVAVQEVIRVGRVDPERVVVDMLGALADAAPGGTTVIGDLRRDVHREDAIDLVRVRDEHAVVHRLRRVAAATCPRRTAIL